MKEPKLEDFYDENDPRGCSTREFEKYEEALRKYKNGSKDDI